jgi:hypothetical protein
MTKIIAAITLLYLLCYRESIRNKQIITLKTNQL